MRARVEKGDVLGWTKSYTKTHLDTILVIAHQLLCQKWMQILFRESTQPLVLYWTYKARDWKLPQTMKILSSVDDAEYSFMQMTMEFNTLVQSRCSNCFVCMEL